MQNNKQQKEKKKLENVIQNEIFEYLMKHNYFFWRSNNVPVFQTTGSKYRYRSLPKHTPKGLPDIIIIHESKFIAIEVKTKYRKLTPEQADIGLKIIKNGGYYLIARSVDDVQKGLALIVTGKKDITHDIYKNVPHKHLDNIKESATLPSNA